MDDLDPHLAILLQDLVRLCPDDAPLESDDWTGLHEICVFIQDQNIEFAPSTFREFLIQHGWSANKAMVVSHQYSQRLQALKLAGDGAGHSPNKGATDASISV